MVFALAAFVLAIFAGKQLTKPSANNHFVHLANAWLHGRLHHDGKPPGYCTPKKRRAKRCRGHRFDDWAVVWTLRLADEEVIRGYPCRTEACRETRRRRGVETWWVLGEGWAELEPQQIVERRDVWYVSFPPGPAIVMLPLVWIWGLGVFDVLVTCLAAAAIPAALVRMFDRERGVKGGAGREHLWLAAAWTLGSPAFFLGANGRVWFTAQVFGALFAVLYISAAWNLRRPFWAGLWLALAVACRPINMVLIFGFVVWQWWQRDRPTGPALKVVVPLVVFGILIAALNVIRFEDPLEFGHRFLEIRWQARMQEVGMFSVSYLRRNLQCLLTLMPVFYEKVPWFKVSIHGSALWLTTPWLVMAPLAANKFPQRAALWICAVLSMVPALLYQNSGQLQFTYRFAVDWLPLVVVAVGFGGVARRRWAFGILVLVACAIQGYGAYQFGRAPDRLFVADPVGWPFTGEFD